jgi:hypothetical protein
MSESPDHKRAVRRIVLPSGRRIEIVTYNDDTVRQLHVCPSCGSELVQPVAWSETEDDRWDLVLECPNCSWVESGTFTRLQVEQLEERLDEGLAAILNDLQRLSQANMSSDVDRFLFALNADLILPEDF